MALTEEICRVAASYGVLRAELDSCDMFLIKDAVAHPGWTVSYLERGHSLVFMIAVASQVLADRGVGGTILVTPRAAMARSALDELGAASSISEPLGRKAAPHVLVVSPEDVPSVLLPPDRPAPVVGRCALLVLQDPDDVTPVTGSGLSSVDGMGALIDCLPPITKVLCLTSKLGAPEVGVIDEHLRFRSPLEVQCARAEDGRAGTPLQWPSRAGRLPGRGPLRGCR